MEWQLIAEMLFETVAFDRHLIMGKIWNEYENGCIYPQKPLTGKKKTRRIKDTLEI